jgi:hypothetical protein
MSESHVLRAGDLSKRLDYPVHLYDLTTNNRSIIFALSE